MVVVVIIGILVAIAVPIYNSVQAQAQEKACFATLRTVDGAAQMAAADGDATTTHDDYLEAGWGCPTTGTITVNLGTKSECSVHGTY
ncbi:MAG: hypothetical protein KGZ63_08605 [Clostridiales bacterium]|jgi:type II secretory pathway pseudopilin PulG|nr:hypothetical protein [Clostridiales bacterium]